MVQRTEEEVYLIAEFYLVDRGLLFDLISTYVYLFDDLFAI